MPIFSTLRGKRSGRRESMFGASDDQPAKTKASSSTPHNRDATDVLGESPSFARNRSPSDTNSLRNRQSSSNMLRIFGSGKRSTSTSGHEAPHPAPGSSSLSDVGHRTSQTTTRPENPASPAPNGTGTSESLSAPRPSELFAGKGVNWEQLKLSGSAVAPSDSKRNDELQTYLKARRQWIPTFKTDEDADNDADRPVARLEELSFGGAPAAPEGLMTLNDLEASHHRKQHLLSDIPISSLTNEGSQNGPSSSSSTGAKSSSKPPLISRTSQSGSSVRAATEAPARNQSFRQSPFVGNGATNSNAIGSMTGSTTMNRTTSIASSAAGPTSPTRKPAPSATAVLSSKSNGNGSANGAVASSSSAAAVPANAPPTVSAPPRKSSVALPAGQVAATSTDSGSTVLAVPTDGGETSSVQTSSVSAAGGGQIRPSMDSTTGFQTPEARSEVAHADPDQTPRLG
ncbi:hypothetical protein CF319_g1705 [Tilletia indica]|nr:hypothetical protein CF319_g1705 [Tilletia indica]